MDRRLIFVTPCLLTLLCLALALGSCAGTPPAPAGEAAPSASAPEAVTQALPYTDDYLLFREADGDGEPLYGLMDRDGKALFPADYRELSVSETGVFFASSVKGEKEIYQVFGPDGAQIGPDYSFIECASVGEGDAGYYRQATALDARPVPFYAACVDREDGGRDYWVLDENGRQREEGPYSDMDCVADGSVRAERDGALYTFEPDGTVEKQESEIAETYFDGKYQVKRCLGLHANGYALLDREGNELAPPEYCRIQVPFEDRYILYKGDGMSVDGSRAFLYDETGKLLANNSNGYGYFTAPDGAYIGVSWIGNAFDGTEFSGGDAPVTDADGRAERCGFYFVDRDGKRLGERYRYIDFFENEAAEHGTDMHYTTNDKSPWSVFTIAGRTVDAPSEAYFVVMDDAGGTTRLPFAEQLVR